MATPLPEPGTTDEPLHEKSWFLGVLVSSIIVVVVVIALPVVGFTVVRYRNQGGKKTSARAPRRATTYGNDTMMQPSPPLMPHGKV